MKLLLFLVLWVWLLLIAGGVLTGCGGSEQSIRQQATTLTASQKNEIGKLCTSDANCGSPLSCSDQRAFKQECAYVVSDTLDCPDGYKGIKPLFVINGQKSDQFCLPICATAEDCSNGQCCIGGTCGTRIPGIEYVVPLFCKEG